jgi:Rieske 2Fe-2S family protein
MLSPMSAAPVPLDREALRRCIAPFGTSFALPGEAHVSPDVLTWEREHLFAPSWMCLGRAGVHRRTEGQVECGGWAFARRATEGLGFDEQFGNLWDHLEPYEPEGLIVGARHSYEVRANWKLIHENYQECYHCSEIHPELCRVTPPDSGYSIEITGLYVAGPMDLFEGVETMSLDGKSHGVPMRGLSGNQLREIGYFGVFPNLLISTHPDYILTHRLEPLAPDRTFVECEWLFPPEAFDREGFDPAYAVEFWDVTNREDWDACGSLQRSAGSRGYRPGPLSKVWEAGVYMQVAMIADSYVRGSTPRVPDQPRDSMYTRRTLLRQT